MTRSDCSIHKIWSEANLDLSVLFCLKEGRIRRFLKVITTSSCICMPCYFKSCVYNYNRVSFIIINALNHSAIFMNVMKIPDLQKRLNICRIILKRSNKYPQHKNQQYHRWQWLLLFFSNDIFWGNIFLVIAICRCNQISINIIILTILYLHYCKEIYQQEHLFLLLGDSGFFLFSLFLSSEVTQYHLLKCMLAYIYQINLSIHFYIFYTIKFLFW